MKIEIGDLIRCSCCPALGVVVDIDDEGYIVYPPNHNPEDDIRDTFANGSILIEKNYVKKKSKVINEPDMEGD